MLIVLAVWALSAFVFSVGALLETRRMLATIARAHTAPASWPALAILRPCAGLDPELEENLLSTATARYEGARELYILVASIEDPAHAVAERVRERGRSAAPTVPIQVVVTNITTRHNRKVAQMVHAEGLSSAPVVSVIDSDIRVDDDTLPALIAALLSDPRAGASGCPPIDVRRDTLGDRASAALLTSTPHAFYCLSALAERSGGAHVLCGAFIAIHRPVLEALGGFRRLEQYLGEDFELARLLHERGHTIPTAAAPARVTDHGRPLSSVIQRFSRWATVTRQQRPHLMITYPLFMSCGPPLLAAALIGLSATLPYARPFAALVLVLLALRVALAMTLRRAYRLSANPLRSLLAMLLGELTILAAFFGALGRPIVAWRGRRYRIGRGGLIELIS